MKIIFNDFMQSSDAPANLISPDLAETHEGAIPTITLDASRTFNAVGIGNTDATTITVDGEAITIPSVSPYPDSYKNGLYPLNSAHSDDEIVISHNGTHIGRLALGYVVYIGCAPARESGFYTTNQSRTTLSGQVIPGAGGYSGRRQDVDIRYKFTEEIINQIEKAYPDQLSRNFPVFVSFDSETHRFMWPRMYATISGIDGLLFQSSVNRKLSSRKFSFREAF